MIQGCQVGNKIPLVLTVVDEACIEFGLIEFHGEIGDVSEKGNGDNCCLGKSGEGNWRKSPEMRQSHSIKLCKQGPRSHMAFYRYICWYQCAVSGWGSTQQTAHAARQQGKVVWAGSLQWKQKLQLLNISRIPWRTQLPTCAPPIQVLGWRCELALGKTGAWELLLYKFPCWHSNLSA